MKKKSIRYIVLVIWLMAPLCFTQVPEENISLSLEKSILLGLKNNLDIAVEVLNPELADISISQANEKFMPQLSLNYNKRDTEQASYSFLDATDQVTTVTDTYGAQLTQAVPTGGTFTISVDGYATDTNRSFQTINPRYGNALTFSFSQPLLKDFGFKIARKDILVARNNRDISQEEFRSTLIDTINSIEEAYWTLVYDREILKVRQQSLQLARDLLAKNIKAVEIGTMARIEILSAEAEVATREADILQAEAMERNSEDILRSLINLNEIERDTELIRIIPTNRPSYKKKDISLEEALLTALAHRPDLAATRIDLLNKELDLTYAKNQLLPNLSFQASYWSPGVSGDQLLYLNNNALTGVVIGVIPGGAADAFNDAVNFRYQNWTVGFTLDIPIDSILSRATLAQAQVTLRQSQLRKKNQEQQAFLEIKNSVRSVQTDFKRVEAYRVARELAEKKLEAEEEKLRVGLTTNYMVLTYQRELTDALTMELKSIIDYNLSLSRLSKALGTTLQEKNIEISQLLEN